MRRLIALQQKQNIIISHYLEGESQRAIARKTGVSRKTVKKYITEYETKRAELLNGDPNAKVDPKELTDSIVMAPKYDASTRSKRKLTPEIIDAIQAHLDDNEKKRQNGQSKIQKKKIDIYEAEAFWFFWTPFRVRSLAFRTFAHNSIFYAAKRSLARFSLYFKGVTQPRAACRLCRL